MINISDFIYSGNGKLKYSEKITSGIIWAPQPQLIQAGGALLVKMIGGGGAGGSTTGSGYTVGQGGQAGTYKEAIILMQNLDDRLVITIGIGGPNNSGSHGFPGTDTSVTYTEPGSIPVSSKSHSAKGGLGGTTSTGYVTCGGRGIRGFGPGTQYYDGTNVYHERTGGAGYNGFGGGGMGGKIILQAGHSSIALFNGSIDGGGYWTQSDVLVDAEPNSGAGGAGANGSLGQANGGAGADGFVELVWFE